MKRILASAGLVALGAGSLNAMYAPGLSPLETTKPWTVGLSLAGFYDSNYATSPNSEAESSWGIDVRPYVAINIVGEQTYVGLRYIYSAKYYAARPSDNTDQSQFFNFELEHAFSERVKINVNDMFVVSDEGTLYVPGQPTSDPLRTDANYFRNIADLGMKIGITEKMFTRVSYQNQFWDYNQDGNFSRSAMLDRIQQYAGIELGLQMTPNTAPLIGYRYAWWNYTSDNLIQGPNGFPVGADTRDLTSNFIYAGIDHTFSPTVSGNLNAGAQINSYPNSTIDDPDSIIPYVEGKISWNYNPGSYATLGLVNTLNATDVSSALNQSSILVYGTITHRISGNLSGTLTGSFQNSTYQGGMYDGDTDQLILAQAGLNYKMNEYVSFGLNYIFDRLCSGLPDRQYSRSRFFFGLTAQY